MEEITSFKTVIDDFQVEYDIILPINTQKNDSNTTKDTSEELLSIEEKIRLCENQVDEINSQLYRVTNHADRIDYAIAVASGTLTGLIDSLWVGEFSLERGKNWSSEKINNFVTKLAGETGYDGNDLQGAIRHLEKYGAPSDSVYGDLGGAKQHHLRDFAHHPTPVGLIFSMLTQFTSTAYGTDTLGNFKTVPIKDQTFIGKDLKQKFLFGTVYWFLHMASDIAGSNSSAGAGTGLPGPILSLLKELSALPIFKNSETIKELRLKISQLFNGTLLAKRDENGKILKDSNGKPLVERIDFRAEMGIVYELGRQAVPITINECLIRSFYFIRRLILEIKEKKHLQDIDWKKTLPFKNRTLTRMMIISTGSFTAVDLADAGIRALMMSAGTNSVNIEEIVLRVNFVGIGRFTIACGSEIKMGINKRKIRNERISAISQQISLLNAKTYYKQAEMWITAENTEKAIIQAYDTAEKSFKYAIESWQEMHENSQIQALVPKIEEKNPGLVNRLLDIL